MGNKHLQQLPYQSLYEIKVTDMDSREVQMSEFRGKVLLIVNVASKWELTSNTYAQLISLYSRFNSLGFEVLAFPCGQFFNQEYNKLIQIKQFLANHSVRFPVFDKVKVNGKKASDLFKYLRLHSDLKGKKIPWNFGKFLVDRHGTTIKYYRPRLSPLEIENDIQELI